MDGARTSELEAIRMTTTERRTSLIWVVQWEDSTGRRLEEATNQTAAETRVHALRNRGITRAIAYQIEDQEH